MFRRTASFIGAVTNENAATGWISARSDWGGSLRVWRRCAPVNEEMGARYQSGRPTSEMTSFRVAGYRPGSALRLDGDLASWRMDCY